MDRTTFFSLIITAGSCTLLSAVILIWLGFRGKHAWSSPYCRKCKYDLRGQVPEETKSCPECGATLDKARAIGYVRHRARWSLVVLGTLVLLSPGIVFGGLYGVQRIQASRAASAVQNGSPAAIHALPIHEMRQQTDAVVVEWVAGHVDEPWGWRELEKRIKAGTLAKTDAAQAIDHLIAYMVAQNPGGYDQPLSWQGDYVAAMMAAGMFDDTRLMAFVNAYHGKAPRLSLNRVKQGSSSEWADIQIGSNWSLDLHGGLSYQYVSAITQIEVAGQPIEMKDVSNYSNRTRFRMDVSALPPGEHEVVVHAEIGLARKQDLAGFDPNQAKIKDWPKMHLRWSQQGKATLTVYDPADPPVKLTTDPALAPTDQDLLIKQAIVRSEAERIKVFLEVEAPSGFKVPLGMRPTIKLGDQEIRIGNSFTHRDITRTRPNTRKFTGHLDALPAEVTHATLVLTPDPSLLYRYTEIDQCWGEEIVIDQIPLERKDLSGE